MAPDLILINANIRTMDPSLPHVPALAIGGGRLLALGTSAEMQAMAGPDTRVIDAGGRLVLPGLQDAHVHLMDGGTDLIASAALWDVTSVATLQARLRDHAARVDMPLVMGAGWQAGFFGDDNLTAAVLDAVVPDRPCIVFDSSYHNACINTVAMRLAGVARGVADPLNGHFVLDVAGNPTGMLHEDAIYWVRPKLPPITDATYLNGLRAGQAHANRHGITGVLDPHIKDQHLAAYGALARAGDLTLRVSGAAATYPEDTAASVIARLSRVRTAHPGPDFWVQSAKFFFDGVLENRTGVMIEPYADARGGNAALMYAPEKIAELFTALDAARFQIHVHVIGDGAVRAALDGFAAARAANGSWPARHQLAHLQMMHQDDFARLGRLGVTANIQPLWAQWDPGVPDPTLAMVGEARAPLVYAFRQMLDAGARYCLSSDWPVTTLNPFEIIETAVTRQPPGNANCAPFFAAERLTVAEAVLGYTAHAAETCWRGDFTGRLLPGFSADLVVLDRDILTCAPYDIGKTQVLLTLFKGREVYRDERF
ncbi:MAG: amidohydrolase [Paracoccaceae bacterium]